MHLASEESPQGLRKRLAKQVAVLRRDRGWSQEELADRLGMQRERLSKMERGRCNLGAEDVLALSRVFGITTDEFLTGVPPARRTLSPEEDAKLIEHLSAALDLLQ